MDYKEKVIAILNSKELSKEQKEKLEEIFPELKESEDERIRKEILELVIQSSAILDKQNQNSMIAWLEKQGEQKPVDVEPKFKVGDWCIDNEDGTIFQILKVLDNTYTYKTNEGKEYYCPHYSLENDARIWTVADAKPGDVLHSPSHRLIWIYKDNEHYHACVNMNYVTENVATDGLIYIPNDACPATKDEQTILFAKMKEAGYEWDAEKKIPKKIENEIEIPFGAKDSELQEVTYYIPKGFYAEIGDDEVVIKKGEKPTEKPIWYDNMDDLIADGMIDEIQKSDLPEGSKHNRIYWINKHRVQSKQEWSEEDKNRFNNLIFLVECSKENDATKEGFIRFINKLKSLRHQNTWKPSDEQMEQLGWIAKQNKDNMIGKELMSLYQNLKKLREG